MLNESAEPSPASEVLIPSFQTEREQVCEQGTLDFGVEQVLCVFEKITRLRAVSGA